MLEANVATKTTSKTSRDKVRRYRQKLREQGLRPIQIWVPDVNSPAFVKEARRQSRLVARSEYAKEDQDFVDSISAWNAE
jgi:hypothetical protein